MGDAQLLTFASGDTKMPFKYLIDKARYMAKYNSRPSEIRRRSRRNALRAEMEKQGRVHKGDGKEVSHKIAMSKGGGDGDENVCIKTQKENRKQYTKTERASKKQVKKTERAFKKQTKKREKANKK